MANLLKRTRLQLITTVIAKFCPPYRFSKISKINEKYFDFVILKCIWFEAVENQ